MTVPSVPPDLAALLHNFNWACRDSERALVTGRDTSLASGQVAETHAGIESWVAAQLAARDQRIAALENHVTALENERDWAMAPFHLVEQRTKIDVALPASTILEAL